MKVIGAGLGRTGTYSLKLALERLYGEPCYHMMEVFHHPEHVPMWHAAAKNQPVDWHRLFQGYSSSVDWPSAAFYEELMAVYPEALVVHSTRDPEAWWESAHETIFSGIEGAGRGNPEWLAMIMEVLGTRFTSDIHNRPACIDAFNRFNDKVDRTVPPERLLVFRATEGWAPLCEALNMPIPDEPFPKANTREEFIARIKAREAEAAAH